MEKEAKVRYSRQIAVDGIGETGQTRLMNGSVGVIGCGALGSLAAMYLAGAGIGRIGIADFDCIDLSNLQRQLFYCEADAGKKKTDVLAESMSGLNSGVVVEKYDGLLRENNIDEFISRYDIIIDATDNAATKFMVDDHCRNLGKVLVTGGVAAMRGQITTCLPDSHRFEALYPEIDDPMALPCAVEGVVGPAAGVLASLQASEAVKYFVAPDTLLADRLLIFDLSQNLFQIVNM